MATVKELTRSRHRWMTGVGLRGGRLPGSIVPGRMLRALLLCTLGLSASLAVTACDSTAAKTDPATTDAGASADGTTADGTTADGAAAPAPLKAGFVPVDPARTCPSPAPEWHCMAPWPSDFHRAANPAGGARVILPKQGVPTTDDGDRVDWITDLQRDGSGILPQIAARIPGGVAEADLVGPEDEYDDSMKPSVSPTLLIDTVTGKPVAHFAEIDPRPKKADLRALLLRPLRPLQWGRRYVVAVQRLKHPDGAAVARSATFARIFTGQGLDDSDATTWQRQQATYYNKFVHPVLKQAGVVADDVVLAWDFTTGHASSVRGRLAAMVKDANTQIAAGGFGEVTILSTQAGTSNAETAWWIRGEIALPAYVSGSKHPSPHKTTHATSSFKVPFAIMVSRAAVKLLAKGGTPPVIVMGHGFFGDEFALLEGGYRHAAQACAGVGIGISWWGLSKTDASPVIGGIAGDLNKLRFLVDRLEQGMANVSALAALTRRPADKQKGAGKRLTDLTLPDGTTPIIQPNSRLSYYGVSLGHILGSTAVALSPGIERAAMQVGGAGWGMIMPRSQPFGGLLAILSGRFPDQGHTLLATLELAEALASVDPVTWAPELSQLPTGAERPLLLHAGLGDAAVPLMSAELQARSLGLPLLTPAPQKVWGLAELPVQGASRGFVEVDFGVPNPAVQAIPPNKSTKVHNGMRGLKAIRAQIGAFMNDNAIPAVCSGVCDPE